MPTRAWVSAKRAFSDAIFRGRDLVDVLGELVLRFAEMQLQQQIFDPVFGGLGSLASGLFGGSTVPAKVAHRGNIGSTPVPTTLMPASLFMGAPRFHTGLLPNEFPAILEQGETVIPRGRGVAIGEPPVVNFTIHNNAPVEVDAQVTRRDANSIDVSAVITQATIEGMRPGAPIDRVLRTNYNLQRRTR